MKLAEQLRRLRHDRGMTQKQLASPRYTAAYVSTIEAGVRRPSPEALSYFAGKLGVTEEELVSGRSPDLVPRLELTLHEARRAASRGNLDEAQKSFARVAREASRHDLVELRARAEQGLGLCLLRAGDAEGALERYDRAIRLLAPQPMTARVDAVAGKAACLHRMGDVRHAIYILENALENLTRSGLEDPGALLKVYASLIGPYFASGAYDRASDAAAKALDLAPQASEPERLGSMYLSAARAHLEHARFLHAREALRLAEELFRQADLQVEIGQAHLALGYVLIREGQLEEARAELEIAQGIFKKTGSAVDEARTLNEMARLERRLERPGEARTLLRRSIRLLEGERDVAELALAHREMGLAEDSSRPEKAEKHLRKAIELYDRADAKMELAATYAALGDVYYGRNEWQSACEEYRSGILALDHRL